MYQSDDEPSVGSSELDRIRREASDLLKADAEKDFRREYSAKLEDVIRSDNTKRSYESDWRHFKGWCDERGLEPLPAPEKVIIAYLLYWGDPEQPRREGDKLLRPNTLARRVAGIKSSHARVHAPWPEYLHGENDLVSGTVKYIAIKQKAKSTRSKALDKPTMERAVKSIPRSEVGNRNRALILTGFYGALRRSELIGIDMDDLFFSEPDDEGIVTVRVYISRSKTDKKAEGDHVYISSRPGDPYCPIEAIHEWIGARGSHDGALFTSIRNKKSRITDHWFNKILKAALEDAGADPAKYSAHSLRSGFATTASNAGVPPNVIREQTRHSSLEMLGRYIHDGASMKDNATRHI